MPSRRRLGCQMGCISSHTMVLRWPRVYTMYQRSSSPWIPAYWCLAQVPPMLDAVDAGGEQAAHGVVEVHLDLATEELVPPTGKKGR